MPPYKNQDIYKIWVRTYARKYWYMILILLILAAIAVLFQLASPLPLKFLADNVFGKEAPPHIFAGYTKEQLLLLTGVGYIAINGLQTLYGMLQIIIGRKMNQHIDRSTMEEAVAAALKIPYNDADRPDQGTYLYQITNQSQQMSELLLTNVASIVQSALTLVGIIIVLSSINLKVMLITFISMPILAVCIVYFSRLIERRANDTETANSKVYAFVDETLSKLRTIQSFVLQSLRLTQLRGFIINRNKLALKQTVSDQLFDLTTEIIILSSIALAIIVGGRSVLEGAMTFGDLLIFISYTNNVFDQVSDIAGTIGSIKGQQAALRQAYDAINLSSTHFLTSGLISEPIQGKIEFRNVRITRSDTVILENTNLLVEAGSTVAFVGPSGSGKTTLFDSLERFVTIDAGWIMIDNVDIREIEINHLRRNIALLEQEPDLFNMTIGENIALANPDRPYNLPDIMAAATVTNSAPFIDSSPEKYDANVDNGHLSGGQKQRLAYARAYYKKAPIILMDEPTSALDKTSANYFVEGLSTYFKNRTVLIITHDLSLLEKIPNIYVIKDKQIKPISEYGGLENYRLTLLKNP
jgi:ABC-type multidrug transport system fused ATPase/permease subunit